VNRKRRDILNALTPVTALALGPDAGIIGNVYGAASPLAGRAKRDVPGLSMNIRADGAAELMIYGPIGGSMWEMGITAVDVAQLLREAGTRPVNMRINSGGGDVFQGVAIHTLLARHPGAVNGTVDGLAASAASVIMLAADRLDMSKAGFVMIHDAMTATYGNADSHDRTSATLRTVSDAMAELYADRAGEDAAFWRNLMTVNGEDGTWYSGQQAVDAGLVDGVIEPAEEDEATAWARLAAWDNVLPESIRAEVRAHARSIDEKTTPPVVAWDVRTLSDLMKEAMA
jgi:ATP-dependent protease ClpP protease subunit